MNKSKIQANLFLYYLRFKKPLLILAGAAAIIIVGLNGWIEFKRKTINPNPWLVTSVGKDASLKLTRDGEAIEADLCGVKPFGTSTERYLSSVIALGNGTVELQKTGDRYEVWMYLKSGYDVELVRHLSPIANELVGQQIHINSWIVERGYANHDVSDRCTDSEILALAEKIAKEKRLGAWGE